YSLVAEAEPVEHARAETFEQHVGAGDQAPQHLLARVRLQVERNRAFAEVGGNRVGAVASVTPAERPGPVALAGRLDFDDIGAVLGKQHPAIGSSHPLAQIYHLEPSKGRVIAHGWVSTSGGGRLIRARC